MLAPDADRDRTARRRLAAAAADALGARPRVPCADVDAVRNACMAAALLAASGLPNAAAQIAAANAYAEARQQRAAMAIASPGLLCAGETLWPPLDPVGDPRGYVEDGDAWATLAACENARVWATGAVAPRSVAKMLARCAPHEASGLTPAAGGRQPAGFAGQVLSWAAARAVVEADPDIAVAGFVGLRRLIHDDLDELGRDGDGGDLLALTDVSPRAVAAKALTTFEEALHKAFWVDQHELYAADAGGGVPTLAGNLLAVLFDFRGARQRAPKVLAALRRSCAWAWGALAAGPSAAPAGPRVAWIVALQAWLAGFCGDTEERAALVRAVATEWRVGEPVPEEIPAPRDRSGLRSVLARLAGRGAAARRNGPAAAALLIARVA